MKGNLMKIQLETVIADPERELDRFLIMPRHKIITDLIMKYCKKHESILDVGCGAACSQLLLLRKRGFTKLAGLDFDARYQFDGIAMYCQDLEEPLDLSEKFDNIILADVLEHLRYPRLALNNLLKMLNTNGRIFVSVPNAGHFYNGLLLTLLPRHLNMSAAFGPWGHYYFFTYYSLEKLFALFKLEIEEFAGSDLEFRFMGMHWTKRVGMWILNFIPMLFNFGPLRKYFSDHLYFVLKKTDDHLFLTDKEIFDANN